AGVGPWLPSQMLCAAWVGLGAGLLPRKLGGRAELLVLIGYGIVAAHLFGALMKLWFWPFISGISIDGYPVGAGSLDYVPGVPPGDNLVRCGWFVMVTATAGWDTGRHIPTTVALHRLGRPVRGALR